MQLEYSEDQDNSQANKNRNFQLIIEILSRACMEKLKNERIVERKILFQYFAVLCEERK